MAIRTLALLEDRFIKRVDPDEHNCEQCDEESARCDFSGALTRSRSSGYGMDAERTHGRALHLSSPAKARTSSTHLKTKGDSSEPPSKPILLAASLRNLPFAFVLHPHH